MAAASRASSPGAAAPAGIPLDREPAGDSPRRGLAGIQRARIVAAMTSVAARDGAGRASVARVVGHSSMSRRTFYELFEDREQCFVAAFDDGAERARQVVADAYGGSGKWRARLRDAIAALLGFFEGEPDLARVLVVEALAAGPVVLERRRSLLQAVATVVDRDGRAAAGNDRAPPLAADVALGGALSVVHSRIAADRASELSDLASPLASMLVLPYLGAAAARAELRSPASFAGARADRDSAGAGEDPLQGLNMRLTYRTILVLKAVADRPGASNRQVADGASIRDQGQISKLLARLEHLGLVANDGLTGVKGKPNAWSLTDAGREVSRTWAFHAVG